MEAPEAEVACVHCRDLGFISFLVPLGHPKFGKAAPCPHCALGQGHLNRRADLLLKRAGVPDAYRTLSFESFVALPEGLKQGKLLALHALWALAQNPEKGLSLRDVVAQETDLNPEAFPAHHAPWLMLYGGLGMGKTGLAAAFVNQIVLTGVDVLFYRLQELFVEIQSRYGESGMADDTQERISRTQVLVLDECNVPTNPNGTASVDKRRILEEICRFRHARRLPTVFTGNLDQSAFTRMWGERTASVVCEGHWLELTGVPLRLRARTVKSF
ncbi:MAG: ATP-binding protein [Anaerolineae bacterium]|nr:ATP-binding protein [Anaerolineae bacterium]